MDHWRPTLEKVSQIVGQPLVMENRPGAGHLLEPALGILDHELKVLGTGKADFNDDSQADSDQLDAKRASSGS